MNKYCFRLVLVLTVAGWFASFAQAQDFIITDLEGSTDAEILFFQPGPMSPPPVHDEIQPPPSLDTLALSEVQSNIGTVFIGRAAAFQSVFGINAAFVEVSQYFPEFPNGHKLTADTHYAIEVESVSDLTGQTVPFEFVINSGQLRIDDFAVFEPFGADGIGAFASAEIGIDGLRWRFDVGLTKDINGDLVVVTDHTDDFFGFTRHPTLTIDIVDADNDGAVDDAVVDIPKITGEIFIDGADFEFGVSLSYDMETRFEMFPFFDGVPTKGLAGITDPFSLGNGDPNDDVGVEFFLGGQPLSDFPAVPEPGTAAVLGAWLLGLIATRRRQ